MKEERLELSLLKKTKVSDKLISMFYCNYKSVDQN